MRFLWNRELHPYCEVLKLLMLDRAASEVKVVYALINVFAP